MASNPGGTALGSVPQKDRGAMEIGGLCLTCEEAQSCSFKRNPQDPVLFCEEFNVSRSPLTAEPKQEPIIVSKAQKVTLYTGLCINCDHRDNCVYIETGAGGWHCEEYA